MSFAMKPSSLLRLTRQAGNPRSIHSSVVRMDDESVRLKDLMAKFQDPTSHYHIPPGSTGPSHEEDHSSSHDPRLFSRFKSQKSRILNNKPSSSRLGVPETRPSIQWSSPSEDGGRNTPHDRPWLDENSTSKKKALDYFKEQGHDTAGALTWPVAWGDCDSFRHVNNVRFLEWIQSARIRYAESWAADMPEGSIPNLLAGKGTGIILKDVSLKYIAPVNYPDTVIVTNQIHSINQERASYGHKHLIWSLRDERVATIADSTVVMYDYDNLKKGKMSDQFKEMLDNVVASYGK